MPPCPLQTTSYLLVVLDSQPIGSDVVAADRDARFGLFVVQPTRLP